MKRSKPIPIKPILIRKYPLLVSMLAHDQERMLPIATPGTTIGGGRGRGRGRGRTPGLHCFGAGGQSYRTVAPDGRTHLIPRSVSNSPPQPSASEQYIPGVTVTRCGDGSHQGGENQSYPITSTLQNWLSRQMTASNRTTSYIAHCGRNLPVAADTLCDCNNPYHMDACEDGTFVGLEDDEDATGIPLAIVPCGTQPDPIVSQQAIVPYARRTTAPHTAEDSAGVDLGFPFRLTPMSFALRVTNSP